MVTSKAGGVATGGAQGTANAGASEFSGANFTYMKILSEAGASTDWTAQAGTDGPLVHVCEFLSTKGTLVAVSGQAAGIVDVIFEGPYGWGVSADAQVDVRATLSTTGIDLSGATVTVSSQLTLGVL